MAAPVVGEQLSGTRDTKGGREYIGLFELASICVRLLRSLSLSDWDVLLHVWLQ